MDPITIAAGSLAIAKFSGTLIVALPDIWKTYSTAQSQLDDIISLLHSLKIATTALTEMLPLELNGGVEADDTGLSQTDRDLKSAVRINLNGCATLLKDLSAQVELVTGLNNKLTKWRKAKYVWKKSDLDQLEWRLDRRVNALNLILNILSNPSRRVEVFSTNSRDSRELKNAADEVSLYSKSDDLSVVTRTFSKQNGSAPVTGTEKDQKSIPPAGGRKPDKGSRTGSRPSSIVWADKAIVQKPAQKSPYGNVLHGKTATSHTPTGRIDKKLPVLGLSTPDPESDRWESQEQVAPFPPAKNTDYRYQDQSHHGIEPQQESSSSLTSKPLDYHKGHHSVHNTKNPSYYVCVAPPRKDRTDCFWIDSNGYIQHARGSSKKDDHEYEIAQLGTRTFPREGYITACHHGKDKTYIFAVDHDGRVCGNELDTSSSHQDVWSEWHQLGDLTVTPGAYICALARPVYYEWMQCIRLFVCKDDQVLYMPYSGGDGWLGFWVPLRKDTIKVVDGSPIAATGDASGLFQVLVTDIDGVVNSTTFDSKNVCWRSWSPIFPKVKTIPGGAVTAMERKASSNIQRGARYDMYIIDTNNVVRHAEMDPEGEWSDWDQVAPTHRGDSFVPGGWANAIEHNECMVVAAISADGHIMMTSGLETPGSWEMGWFRNHVAYGVGHPGAFVGFSRRQGYLEFNCILKNRNRLHKAQQRDKFGWSLCEEGGWRDMKGPPA